MGENKCLSGKEGPASGNNPATLSSTGGRQDKLAVYGCFRWGFKAVRQKDSTFKVTRTMPKIVTPTLPDWKAAGDHSGPVVSSL